MLDEHKVVDKLKISTFVQKIKEYGYNNIEATNHTFVRLSSKQRKIYTEKNLKDILFYETPIDVSLQRNNNYAVVYLFKGTKQLKIMLDLSLNKIYIVTFFILNKGQEVHSKDG